MNINEQNKSLFCIFADVQNTLLKKGNDYSNEDRLSNFKQAGSILGVTPERQCLSLISVKVARLSVLMNNEKTPNNESIDDSILDLINYSILLKQIREDNEKS